MSAQHTPGPWSASNEGWGCFYVRDADGQQLIWLGDSSRFGKGENEANARLIAAAPEMMEALQAQYVAEAAKSLWYLCDEPVISAENTRLKQRYDESTHNARILRDSAIAKATGKEGEQ